MGLERCPPGATPKCALRDEQWHRHSWCHVICQPPPLRKIGDEEEGGRGILGGGRQRDRHDLALIMFEIFDAVVVDVHRFAQG